MTSTAPPLRYEIRLNYMCFAAGTAAAVLYQMDHYLERLGYPRRGQPAELSDRDIFTRARYVATRYCEPHTRPFERLSMTVQNNIAGAETTPLASYVIEPDRTPAHQD